MATRTSLTIEDFERLPDNAVRNRELVDGELVDVSGNTPRHNLLRDDLLIRLREWIARQGEGIAIAEQEYDFLGNAHGPDVSYFGHGKERLLDMNKRVQRFVPDVAVEIASASDAYNTLLRKKDRYRRAGTGEVWLVSPETCEIAIYSDLGDRILHLGDTIVSDQLPAFALALDELFRGYSTR